MRQHSVEQAVFVLLEAVVAMRMRMKREKRVGVRDKGADKGAG